MKNYVVVLGSNLPSKFGNSVETLKKCIEEIKYKIPLNAFSESNWYVSPSLIDKSEPKYVNVGIRFDTGLQPNQLLSVTSDLEKKYERTRKGRWKLATSSN